MTKKGVLLTSPRARRERLQQPVSPRHGTYRRRTDVATPKFKIYEKTGWRWMLIDGNNEPIATSEPYDSKANARSGAENVKSTAPAAVIEDA